MVWGEGDFSVSVFHSLSFADEQALLNKAKAWTQAKAEHGYHAITQPVEYGGLGLTREHSRAFAKLESLFVTPTGHETHSVTVGLIAPTINVFGTQQQKDDFIGRFLATKELACQLFLSLAPAATSPHWLVAQIETATSGSSMVRRFGPQEHSSPSGVNSSHAAMLMLSSTKV